MMNIIRYFLITIKTKCALYTLRDFKLLLAMHTLTRASNLRSKIIFFVSYASFARSAFLYYRITRFARNFL